jgi:hypothetical protein
LEKAKFERRQRRSSLIAGGVLVAAAMGLFSLPFGIVRTIIAVLKKFVLKGKQPLRIDLPFPFIPLDIVFVSDVEQIRAIQHAPDVADHLHRVDTKQLPKWTQLYFGATHFHNGPRDKWFLAFESTATCPAYAERKAMHEKWLAPEFTDDDVKNVANLLRANADEDAVADAVAQIIIGRGLLKKQIPSSVIKTARNFLRPQITDVLIPGHYSRSKEAQEKVYEWCAANAPEGVLPIDMVHSFGSVTGKFATAIMKLKSAKLDDPVEHLFTRAANCPTPTTPRVFLQTTTFKGMLAYPANPLKTVVLINNAKAAEASGSLFFTLGGGEAGNRVCSFKNYFVHFMQALQQELKSGPKLSK